MHIERFFVPGLAHASYLVASGNEAVVIDPERNVGGCWFEGRALIRRQTTDLLTRADACQGIKRCVDRHKDRNCNFGHRCRNAINIFDYKRSDHILAAAPARYKAQR